MIALRDGVVADLPRHLRILHLEDNPADAELIHAALESEGVIVEARRVETREEFLAALAEGSFDIILSDYALPSFDGISAARELRRRDVDIPMIVISGTLGEDRAVEALKAGATDFLGKQHLSRIAPAVARAIEEARERTALRRAEDELQESRRFLQRVIDASPNLIYVFDLEQRRTVYLNPQSAAVLGYTPEELQRLGPDAIQLLTHPADLPGVLALWDHMREARDGEVRESDHRVRGANGRWRWLRTRRVPFKRVGGAVREVLGAALDITDQKEAEQRRDAQQALTSGLAESATWREASARAVEAIGSSLNWSVCEIWTIDAPAQVLRLAALWTHPALPAESWTSLSNTLALGPGPGPLGRVWASGLPLWLGDVGRDPSFTRAPLAAQLGLDCGLATPIRLGQDISGLLVVLGNDARPSDGEMERCLDAFGTQIAGFRLRKATEQALRESEEKFRSIVETTAEWIWAVDATGTLTYSNPAVETILGYTPEELMGRNTSELLHPDSGSWFREHLPVCRAEKRGWKGVTLRWLHRDGGARYLESDSVPMLDADGAVTAFRGSDRDVTERMHAEERIREQAALLEAAQEAILVEDLEARITYWNRGATRLYGVGADEAGGRSFADLLHRGGEEEIAAARRAVLESGEWSGHLTQRTREGREIVVQSHWTLVKGNDGEPRAVLIINTDITEARRMETKFMRAQRMESLGILAGGVAHDLNNILAPILMAVDVFRRKELDEQSRRLMAAVEASARRGADLVRQVLTFARGAEGTRAPLQPRHVLAEMERMVRETFPRSIEIRTDLAPDLWAVMGQSTPLQQVVMNLCVNARDAMAQGGVLTISAANVFLGSDAVTRHPLAHSGPYVCLSIADTGEGIAPDILEHIFDPFFTTKPVGRGTGLGLSTTLSIVNAHGGFIDVKSERGRGTTFHVYVPALPAAVEAEPAPLSEPATGAGELVLVVDDEASIREMVREVLEEFGFAVLTAGGGREAIALFRERQADIRVVVTDLSMPEMDGESLIGALREIDSEVAIIASSGVIEGAPLDTGADALLAKPYTAPQLVDLVRSLARGRG